MKRLKNSLVAFTALVTLFGSIVTFIPIVAHGQERSQNAPPHRGLPKFYLTNTGHNGRQALSACAAGYHMASLWEIFDPSNLRYDTELGSTLEDSGSGPPNFVGWIRTASVGNSNSSHPGLANCQAWTSDSITDRGTAVSLDGFWDSAATSVSPWRAATSQCSVTLQVWCVQD